MDEAWKKAKELRRWLKIEWADLWMSKLDDAVRAENISIRDYTLLFVEGGEIIHATRDYKPLSFSDIFERHVGAEKSQAIDVDPNVGGWRRFAKQNFPPKKTQEKREKPKVKVDLSQYQRKGGSGWLNQARIRRKIKANL